MELVLGAERLLPVSNQMPLVPTEEVMSGGKQTAAERRAKSPEDKSLVPVARKPAKA
jgi:hypothetical protein